MPARIRAANTARSVSDFGIQTLGTVVVGIFGTVLASGQTASTEKPLLAEQVFKNEFLEQVELSFVAEEAGFVDGKVLEQPGELVLALLADEQAIVAVEGVQAALAQAAEQAVLQEVGAAFVEMHAALLVDEGLQELEFRFGKHGRWSAG